MEPGCISKFLGEDEDDIIMRKSVSKTTHFKTKPNTPTGELAASGSYFTKATGSPETCLHTNGIIRGISNSATFSAFNFKGSRSRNNRIHNKK